VTTTPAEPFVDISVNIDFIHEAFIEVVGHDGQFYSGVDRHTLPVSITESAQWCQVSVTGRGGIMGLNPVWLLAIGAIVVFYAYKRR